MQSFDQPMNYRPKVMLRFPNSTLSTNRSSQKPSVASWRHRTPATNQRQCYWNASALSGNNRQRLQKNFNNTMEEQDEKKIVWIGITASASGRSVDNQGSADAPRTIIGRVGL